MIVPATLVDAADCSAILHQWIFENPWFPNHAPESASEQSMRQRAKTGAETVGFVAFAHGYLDCLYLTPEARNRGLGKTLLARAKAASPAGISLWVLAQNNAAVRFYLREGFIEVARGDGSDNEENLPDIRLEWTPKEATNG